MSTAAEKTAQQAFFAAVQTAWNGTIKVQMEALAAILPTELLDEYSAAVGTFNATGATLRALRDAIDAQVPLDPLPAYKPPTLAFPPVPIDIQPGQTVSLAQHAVSDLPLTWSAAASPLVAVAADGKMTHLAPGDGAVDVTVDDGHA